LPFEMMTLESHNKTENEKGFNLTN